MKIIKMTVEIEYGDNYEFCDEFRISPAYFEPFVHGKKSGPPELCYPDEGGFAEIGDIECKYHGCKTFIPVDADWFFTRYAEYTGTDKDAAEKAIAEMLYQHIVDETEDDGPEWERDYHDDDFDGLDQSDYYDY